MFDGNGRGALKPREERRNVVLQARIRADRGWGDACILNLSSQGMLLYSAQPAKLGSVVEIRRGEQAIIARVVWRENNRIGLRSQGRLQLQQVVAGTDLATSQQVGTVNLTADRRKQERRFEHSRTLGRMLEFVSVSAAGALLALAAYSLVAHSLTGPFSQVIAGLAQRQG